MIIYVVYEDAGWGDKSAPRACFSTKRKALKWIEKNGYGYATYIALGLDDPEEDEDTEVL